MPPWIARDSVAVRLAGLGTRLRTALGMGCGVVGAAVGVLEGLVGVGFWGGGAGGGFVFDVGHDAAGPDARIRRGSVR